MNIQTSKKRAAEARGKCAYCGESFVKRAYWQKYCSARCRVEDYYRRKYAPASAVKEDSL